LVVPKKVLLLSSMAAMIQTPSKLPQEVLDKISKAVLKGKFPSRNAAIVTILKEYFKLK